MADLGADAGHRVLRVMRKGGRRARVPLTPAAAATLDAYLADRARQAGLDGPRDLDGPLLATATGGRLRQEHLWELVRRLAREAGVETWEQLSPHSLRHSAITLALDAGASLRDVQDYAGHKDPGPPAATTTPATAWTATPPTLSTPTSLSRGLCRGWLAGVAGWDRPSAPRGTVLRRVGDVTSRRWPEPAVVQFLPVAGGARAIPGAGPGPAWPGSPSQSTASGSANAPGRSSGSSSTGRALVVREMANPW